MSIEIRSLSTNLSIKNGNNTRIIAKSMVREASILKNTILKLDIGEGALRNIFLPIADITLPTHADNNALFIAITNLLTPTDVEIKSELDNLASVVNHLEILVGNMNPAFLQEPMYIDDTNPRVIYTGYAVAGTLSNEAKFAIMRTTTDGNDVIVNEWVNGNLNATNIWDNRETLNYGIARG